MSGPPFSENERKLLLCLLQFYREIGPGATPGMNGLELLKLVKNQWPLTKAVMITGYASTDTAAKAIRLGVPVCIPR